MSIYLPIAEMSMSLPLLLGLGLAVGIISGMFGIGGGFIMTPMLIFLGVPPSIAVGTGVSQVTASSVSGALGHWQRGNVDIAMGLYLIVGGLFGLALGTRLQIFLKAIGQLELFINLCYVVLLGIIGMLMLIESVRALLRMRQPAGTATRLTKHHNFLHGLPFKRRYRVAKLYISTVPVVAIGAVVGWLTAIMGVGGGFLLIPALIYVLRLPTRVALGTSSFQVIFITMVATVLQSVSIHSVDVMLGAPLMLGGVFGAQIGVRMGERLGAEQLRAALALLVLFVAVRMALTIVVQPDNLISLQAIR